ncbi:hypothetical protein [Saccharibacillus sacchari]|uniref:hypothetical protein n=1 Tax=Saccharibacillus sacchari TaxID=456493 RepID=UPI0004BBB0B8|nr:hypothetical protein [Saccharibacillus sacchari]
MFIPRLKGLYAMFLREPLGYKILILSALASAIVFSGSAFHLYAQVGAKLSAAVFFGAAAYPFRGNRKVFRIMMVCMVLCLLLAGKIWLDA